MEKINFPLCCYSNGEVIVEGDSVSYNGGEQIYIFINSNSSFSDLCRLICDELEVDLSKFVLNIKMKLPTIKGWKLSCLNNDKALKAMWACAYHSNAGLMDLYVELIPIERQNETLNMSTLSTNTSFVTMLNQVMNNDHCVSILANNVDQVNEDVLDDDGNEDEDLLLMNEGDFDDDSEDLVTSTAPNVEFTRLHSLDIDFINSLRGKNVVGFGDRGEFCIGQMFDDKFALSQIVRQYHIERNQTFRTTESKPHTVTYRCSRKPNACHWVLRASQKEPATESFTIVTYKGPHQDSCVVNVPSIDHPNMTNTFIAKHVRTLVQADWGVKISILRASITNQFNFTPSYMKAWHAKQKATADLFGDWDESYALLPHFFKAMKEANPGTVVHIVNDDTINPTIKQFNRVFWAFGPSIRGFEHCMPVITIDGTHLYGKYKGVLLIAVGVDADSQIYPFAFAIVDCESIDTWSWFLGCIRQFVTKRTGLCVISDRHVGIMRAMNDVAGGWVEPLAFHRFCIRHHASNIATKHGNRVKNVFWDTAEAISRKKFEKGMKELGKLNEGVKSTLEKIPLSKWSLCNDGGYRYGIKTTNNVETFNGVLKRVRFLPITALVQNIFFRLNSYFVERREIARTRMAEGKIWSEKVTEILEKNMALAAHYKVFCYNMQEGIYEVVDGKCHRNTTQTINLTERTCTCNRWQLLHYPCSHAMAVCRKYSISSDQFVDPFYSTAEYFASYRPSFHPIPDQSNWMPWEGPKIVPNRRLKRGGGRPKSSRIHNEMDNKCSSVRCSLCGEDGHNKRRCSSKASSSTN